MKVSMMQITIRQVIAMTPFGRNGIEAIRSVLMLVSYSCRGELKLRKVLHSLSFDEVRSNQTIDS